MEQPTTETQIQRRFTVTIPKDIREKLGLEEGTSLVWETEGTKIVLHPKTVKGLKGLFKGSVGYSKEKKEAVEKAFIQRSKEYRHG